MASQKNVRENDMNNLRPFLKGNKFHEGALSKIYKIKIKDAYAAAKVFKVRQNSQKIERVAEKFFALNHENIVKLLKFCTDPSAFIFEYCSLDADGNNVHNLKELLDHFNEKKTFDFEQRVNYVHQCSKGLNYLHRQGIVHRDFKPNNILVNGRLTNIQLKITDFDEMVAIKESICSTTLNNPLTGMTLCYTAPEIIKTMARKPSFETDVYAWSITTYEIMSDKWQPWEGVISSMNDSLLIEALREEKRPSMDDIVNLYINVSKEHPIFKLISLGWDENPNNRPTSEEICEKIARIVEQPGKVPTVTNNNNENVGCWKHSQQSEDLMSDGGTRNADIQFLQNSVSKLYIDEAEDTKKQSNEQEAAEGRFLIDVIINNDKNIISDEQYFGRIMLESHFQEKLPKSQSKFITDKIADAKKTGEEQKAAEERNAIEETFNNDETVLSSDEQLFQRELLASPLKVFMVGRSELFAILNIGNDLSTLFEISNKLNFSEEDRTFIKLATAGGGNPAKAWLEHLKANHGKISMEKFKKVLKSIDVEFPSDLNKISFVSELTFSNIKKISELLIPQDGWISAAEKLKYTNIQIEKFRRVVMHSSEYNPANRLFQLIYQRHPDLTVEKFMGILDELKLGEAFKHMDKNVKDRAKKRVSEKMN